VTLFSKIFKKPKHQSDRMCQLPSKKAKYWKEKAKQFFDANGF